MIIFVFVNCPRVKNHASRFTIDNNFFDSTYRTPRYDRFLVFSHAKKQVFSKTLKISMPNSFFPKNDKNLLFNGGLFQQVLLRETLFKTGDEIRG